MHNLKFYESNEIKSMLYDTEKDIYAIVDGASHDKGNKNQVFTYSDLDFFPLYANSSFEPLLHISPLLISIPANHDFLEWIIDNRNQPNNITLLAAGIEQKVLIQHLQGLLEVRLPNYNFAAFRFYDARVLHVFAQVMSKEQAAIILGELSNLSWPFYNYLDEKYYWAAIENNNMFSNRKEDSFNHLEFQKRIWST